MRFPNNQNNYNFNEVNQSVPKGNYMNYYQGASSNYYNNNNMKSPVQPQGNFNPNMNLYGQQGGYAPKFKNNLNYQNQHKYASGNFNQNNQFKYNQQNYYKKPEQFNQFNQQLNDEYNVIQSLQYVTDTYPQLITLNNNNLGFTEKVKNQSQPRFFVIKSFTEEDIHKVKIENYIKILK